MESRVKTLLVIGQFPPPYHGSNVMAKIMVSTLTRLGYSVCFIDKKFSTEISQIGKLTLQKLFRIPILGVEIFIKSLQKKPSLCIYFPAVGKSAFFLDFLYLYIVRICKVPYVLRFGGKGYSLLEKEGFFWNKVVSTTLSNATGGIVLGNKVKRDVNSNIKDNRLVHVPNCVPEPSNNRRVINDGKVRVLFLSNLLPTKGVMEVLKAAKIVLMDKEVNFTLAGSFSSKKFEKEVHSYINSNNIEKYISLPGRVVGNIKANAFESSDIFVFPTYYEREVFATVNVEAMSYGLPVISSAEAAIPEIVQDGITGFIVNPKSPVEIAEKILLLTNDPSLRKSMGEKGKEIFKKKYSYKAHAVNLDRALCQFLQFSLDDKKI